MMATLNIDFGYDGDVKSSLNKAKKAISNRINDYTRIESTLDGISSSTGNLTTANSYITKKVRNLQGKYDRLDKLQTKICSFNTLAENTDKQVANRINKETNSFYKRENIPHGFLYSLGCAISEGVGWLVGNVVDFLSQVGEGISTLWETVKKWYEDNKYWVDIVVDVVMVVAAVAGMIASGGALAAVFAAWGFLKAGTDLIFDVAAYGAYKDGDMELYKTLSEQGLKDVMEYYLGDAGTVLYYGMEIASFIYDVAEMGQIVVHAGQQWKLADRVSRFAEPGQMARIKGRIIKKCGIDLLKKNIGISTDGKFKDITKNIKTTVKLTQRIMDNAIDPDLSIGEKIKKTIWKTIKITKGIDDTGEGAGEILDVIDRWTSIKIPAIIYG